VKDKIEGKAEELKGKVTGDRGTELKGKAKQAVGEAKRLARDLGVDTTRPGDVETPDDPETTEREAPRPARPADP
jgi:hypothetical protein